MMKINHYEDDSNSPYYTDQNDQISVCSSDDGSDDAASHSTYDSNDAEFEIYNNDLIAANETEAVNRSKILIFIVLLAASYLSTVATYYYAKKTELKDFESKFRGFATEIIESSHNEARSVYQSLNNTSTRMTSLVLSTNNSTLWPFVTIPHFEIRGSQLNKMTKAAIMTGFSPIVQSGKMRMKWEKYATNNQYWMYDGLKKRKEVIDNNNNIEGSQQQQEAAEDDNNKSNENPPASISQTIFDFATIEYTNNVIGEVSTQQQQSSEDDYDLLLPVWQFSPVKPEEATNMINLNLLSHPVCNRLFHNVMYDKHAHISEVTSLDWLLYGSSSKDNNDSFDNDEHPHSILFEPIFKNFFGEEEERDDDNSDNNYIVGVVMQVLLWDKYFVDMLPKGVDGVVVVLTDTAGQSFTYELYGKNSVYLGKGDLHDDQFDNLKMVSAFSFSMDNSANSLVGQANDNEGVLFSSELFIHIYPTTRLKDSYSTVKPGIYTIGVALVFFFTSMVFVFHDFIVERRQDKVMESAQRSNAIVSSLFPSTVMDRVMTDAEEQAKLQQQNAIRSRLVGSISNMSKLRNFLGDRDDGSGGFVGSSSTKGGGLSLTSNVNENVFGTKPIADLFPEATVLFADLVGFTAWSSVREPSQVFQLLETLYHSFDEVAKCRGVFKVETIGDCYLAVCGLPDPRRDHAVVMSRFARDLLSTTSELAKKLEISLGPDTGDLSIRIGLHSGPVTAGVLRGEKSRFQLFGDTVNTASRMESNGERDRIHISQETADLLIAAGKGHWISAREGKIFAKGKGELQTYWLEVRSSTATSRHSQLSNSIRTISDDSNTTENDINMAVVSLSKGINSAPNAVVIGKKSSINLDASSTHSPVSIFHDVGAMSGGSVDNNNNNIMNARSRAAQACLSDKVERLVDWNTDVLQRLLKQVVARRRATQKDNNKRSNRNYQRNSGSNSDNPAVFELETLKCQTVLEEAKEIIKLPKFDAKAARDEEDPNTIQFSSEVTSQLHDYVTVIATMYRDNPFHNFEHASHVTMSVVKLLSRVIAPDEVLNDHVVDKDHELVKNLHDHTYGITSDPLTQFAVVFSALIHDVDHPGVPNATLVKEKTDIAALYKNKSVAEQNSVDMAWDLLMADCFKDLRAVIYSNETELKRFRQLVVNTVMATDICDKELKELRNARWDKAFQERDLSTAQPEETHEDVNRKATIVIEHLIQASDIAHTMQHWHIYRKWNERLYQESIHAYRAGRAEKDPTEFWYKGEIGFFDFYIIPLAKKLKDCGVFGVSSDEYLNYALANRREWELKGETIVADMVKKYGIVGEMVKKYEIQ